MTRIQTAPVTLPVSPEALFAFLSDLSRHRAFLEPAAQGFQGEADRHSYLVEVMGMKLPLEFVAKERVAGQRVVLAPGAKKLFDQEVRYEIAPAAEGCSLQIVVEADIPAMMAMMGAEKILQAQLDAGLKGLQALAAEGQLS
jgi:carbon monoxide dehydrogenase subunit G